MKCGENDNRAIPKDKLEDGAYYRGRCRNAREARWRASENLFYHWRTKFGNTFLETIKCQEDETMFDVFIPMEKLDAPTVKPIEFK